MRERERQRERERERERVPAELLPVFFLKKTFLIFFMLMVWENFGSIQGQPSDGTAILNVRAAKTQKRHNLSGEQRTLNHPPLISWNGLCYSLRLNTVSLIVLWAVTERERAHCSGRLQTVCVNCRTIRCTACKSSNVAT